MAESPISQEWIVIPEERIEGMPLGRHIYRPEGFEQRRMVTAPVPPKTVKWARHNEAYNQGNVGSCTGNAAAGALMCDPFWVEGRNLTEADAVDIYSKATHIDGIPGEVYPPNDTGSSGPAVAQVLVNEGLIKSFSHVTDLNSALSALSVGPGIFGFSWLDTFDQPQPSGEVVVTPNSQVRGGHEVQAFGIDVENRQVWFYQSWGPTWGPLGNGTFWMSWDCLADQFTRMSDGTFFTV